MALQTNIDVSVFNVIRYLLLNIVVDILVRRSLDGFEDFRRRLSLFRGRSVSVGSHRIDRYNLLRTLSSGHLLSASLLLTITFIAYVVELALEYAVDSSAIRYATRGNVTRVQYKSGVCSLDDIFTSDNAVNMAFIADTCVLFEDNKYRFYHPIWVQGTEATQYKPRLLCEAVEGNSLYAGDGIYASERISKESNEVLKVIQPLLDNSFKPVGDIYHSLIVLNVSSNDVFQRMGFVTPSGSFTTSFFRTNISDTIVQCIGFTSGRENQDTVVVHVVGCLNGYDEDSSLVLTSGTSFVSERMEDDLSIFTDWNTLVALEIRTRIPRYFRGIRDGRPDSEADPRAYSSFLARAFPQDLINLNKYAIVYRYCNMISLPIENGTLWEEEYEFASSEVRVTATVEKWGILVAVCWVVIATMAWLLVSWVAAWKKMPDKVFGEQHILHRWAEENNAKQPIDGDTKAFLSVEGSLKNSRITATLKRVRHQRETQERNVS